VIPNGWDRDDFPSAKEIDMDKPREGEKVIGHFGALYGARNPQVLWDVLDGITPAWRVVLAGPVSADVRSKIDHANLHVTWLGDLPHKEAVRAMHGCDVLLVTHNQSESAKDSTPGKFFEGLATGLPMLAMGPSPSDLEALCEDTDAAFVAHGDPDAQKTLRGLLENWGRASSTFSSAKDVAKKYERRFLTSELVGLFKEVCDRH
jgi:glycosyltransferase involved in cell wall biosynthesis